MTRPDPIWRRSLRVAACLLALWAVAGVGLGIVFVPVLDHVRFGGFRLGFWWAQQGAILAFVGIVLLNAVWMDRIERASDRGDSATSDGGASDGEAS